MRTQLQILSHLPSIRLEAGVVRALALWLWIQAFSISPYSQQSINQFSAWGRAVFVWGLYRLRIMRNIGREAAGKMIGTIALAVLYAKISFCLSKVGAGQAKGISPSGMRA